MLDRLPDGVARPAYDRAAIRTGVVHLGLGAFHRAHQAIVFDDALAAGDPRWGIAGVSMRSPEIRDRLRPQDWLYAVVERNGGAARHRLVGAIRDVLVAPEDPARVIAALAAPDTHVVTLTITEKGYLPATGTAPTAATLIVAALAARRAAGLAPFSTVSCDNLSDNGARLRGAVLDAADARDPGLARWIAETAAFPGTMVDRIVPATTADDIAAFAAATGIEDQAVVVTEPYFQWVIEDRFCGPRPDFVALGVQLTDDVAPWEAAKLRLLNGAHSAIAYLGGLAGIDFVHQFVARDNGRYLVEALWDESQASLTPPSGLNLAAYRAALMARFGNPTLAHRTRQIAADGSQKLPQRLLAPLAWRRARGLSSPALSLAVAAWMRWQGGRDDADTAITVDDPLAARTATAVAGANDARDRVAALLALDTIFPASLAANAPLRDELEHWLALLEAGGALAALATLREG
ncbi:mannitol dehydrogenase family protein [Sphingomonas sp. UYAg733]